MQHHTDSLMESDDPSSIVLTPPQQQNSDEEGSEGEDQQRNVAELDEPFYSWYIIQNKQDPVYHNGGGFHIQVNHVLTHLESPQTESQILASIQQEGLPADASLLLLDPPPMRPSVFGVLICPNKQVRLISDTAAYYSSAAQEQRASSSSSINQQQQRRSPVPATASFPYSEVIDSQIFSRETGARISTVISCNYTPMGRERNMSHDMQSSPLKRVISSDDEDKDEDAIEAPRESTHQTPRVLKRVIKEEEYTSYYSRAGGSSKRRKPDDNDDQGHPPRHSIQSFR